ncbi:MAG TPA: ACP S-malonyltransferase [Thermomicrobiales bacterium]|nr:ACP S-malonyltransferase [Thermomicrobiales bacterium]
MALRDIGNTPIAYIFPGQGSQTVGMGRDLVEQSSEAHRIFQTADDILGFSLSTLCFEGPADELEDTYNAQPALLTTSTASLAVLRQRAAGGGVALNPIVAAGHSLGQFTALVAADAIDFADALRIVRERGRLMKEAGEKQPGGMAAILGMADAELEGVVRDASSEGVIRVANANCPGQTVISGEIPALERATALAQERGARRVTRLGVSIASHSPLMSAAAEQLSGQLAGVAFRDPEVPVIDNSTTEPLATGDAIRGALGTHMESPVNWTDSVRRMIEMGTETFVELGAGSMLAGLNRRIDRNVPTLGLRDLQ